MPCSALSILPVLAAEPHPREPGRAPEPAEREDWSPFSPAGPRLTALLRAARQARVDRTPMLIIGQPGTGKTALALAIHRNSGGAPLTIVDCAARPRAAELQAKLEEAGAAGAGTVILDRIGELPAAAQA